MAAPVSCPGNATAEPLGKEDLRSELAACFRSMEAKLIEHVTTLIAPIAAQMLKMAAAVNAKRGLRC